MIDEHEPLLLADLEARSNVCACGSRYGYDDFSCRTNIVPGERRNGHAHCRAALLRASESSLFPAGG